MQSSYSLVYLLLVVFWNELNGYQSNFPVAHRLLKVKLITRLKTAPENEVLEEGIVYKKGSKLKKPADNRDQLPYNVISYSSSSSMEGSDHTDAMELGTYLLESSTGCGDYLDLGVRGLYKVKSVSYRYKFSEGRFHVISKKVDVIPIHDPSNPAPYDRSILQTHSVYDILQ